MSEAESESGPVCVWRSRQIDMVGICRRSQKFCTLVFELGE